MNEDIDKLSLDPQDWSETRKLAHRMLDELFNDLETVRSRPVWQRLPESAKATVAGVPYAAGFPPYLPLLPLITDRVVDALTLAGTVDEVTEHVVALGRAGIGHVMIYPFAPPSGSMDDTVRRFGQDVLPAARRALER